MNELPPAYTLRPTARCACCTGTLRWACVTATTPATTAKSKSTRKIPSNMPWSPVDSGPYMSQIIGNALGRSATIPIVMTSETPLPIPRSVICSPSHINRSVPQVSAIMVCIWYQKPGLRTNGPPVQLLNTVPGFNQPSDMT